MGGSLLGERIISSRLRLGTCIKAKFPHLPYCVSIHGKGFRPGHSHLQSLQEIGGGWGLGEG